MSHSSSRRFEVEGVFEVTLKACIGSGKNEADVDGPFQCYSLDQIGIFNTHGAIQLLKSALVKQAESRKS